eukprot:SM000062S19917  [mRNA]  locus=s62:289472:294454:- [translate_table: standard]
MESRTFPLDVRSGGATRLRQTVRAKLAELLGSHTDEVLAEYVVVLVGHGKQQAQAAADLEAFLGEKTKKFVSWLWEHLSANKHLYILPDESAEPLDEDAEDGEIDNKTDDRKEQQVVAEDRPEQDVKEAKQTQTHAAAGRDERQMEEASGKPAMPRAEARRGPASEIVSPGAEGRRSRRFAEPQEARPREGGRERERERERERGRERERAAERHGWGRDREQDGRAQGRWEGDRSEQPGAEVHEDDRRRRDSPHEGRPPDGHGRHDYAAVETGRGNEQGSARNNAADGRPRNERQRGHREGHEVAMDGDLRALIQGGRAGRRKRDDLNFTTSMRESAGDDHMLYSDKEMKKGVKEPIRRRGRGTFNPTALLLQSAMRDAIGATSKQMVESEAKRRRLLPVPAEVAEEASKEPEEADQVPRRRSLQAGMALTGRDVALRAAAAAARSVGQGGATITRGIRRQDRDGVPVITEVVDVDRPAAEVEEDEIDDEDEQLEEGEADPTNDDIARDVGQQGGGRWQPDTADGVEAREEEADEDAEQEQQGKDPLQDAAEQQEGAKIEETAADDRQPGRRSRTSVVHRLGTAAEDQRVAQRPSMGRRVVSVTRRPGSEQSLQVKLVAAADVESSPSRRGPDPESEGEPKVKTLARKSVKSRLGLPARQLDAVMVEQSTEADTAVTVMKKKMRQVELEMIKLKARQAEALKKDGAAQSSLPGSAKPLLMLASVEDVTARSIFVTNVHFAATKEMLAVLFGQFGQVVRVTLLNEPSGKARGCAYVEFASRQSSQAAVAQTELSLLSRTLKVVPKSEAGANMPASSPRGSPGVPAFAPKPQVALSNLQWKRDQATLAGSSMSLGSPAVGIGGSWKAPLNGLKAFAAGTGKPVAARVGPLKRSLSYVRPAPYSASPNGGMSGAQPEPTVPPV